MTEGGASKNCGETTRADKPEVPFSLSKQLQNDKRLLMGESFWSAIRSAMWWWNDIKLSIERLVSFSTDSLHVILGVLILLVAAFQCRRPVSHWLPWMIVVVFACFNEIVDITADPWPEREMQYRESMKDVLLTLFLPTVLLVMARLVPRLFSRPAEAPSNTDKSGA